MSKRDQVPLSSTHLVRDTCLHLHVQRAARALARRFDEVFRPLELPSGQFSLLMSLNRPQPPSIGSVAALLAMDRTTLTANLKPLRRRGVVPIDVDHNDRRGRLWARTAVGRKLLRAAVPIWVRTHEAIERDLRKTDVEDL